MMCQGMVLPSLLRLPARPEHGNPHVQAEILKIMGFWLQLGVHGFRMDAVPFFIGTKGLGVEDPEEQFEMLRKLREFLQWRQGTR